MPTCPACRYELSNLPDGPCPECGRAFTLQELRAAHGRRRSFDSRALLIAIAWTLFWFVVAVFLSSVTGESHFKLVILAWTWMSLAWVFRRELGRSPMIAFALTFVPAAVCTWVSGDTQPTSANPRGFQFLPITLAACLTAVTLAGATAATLRPAAALAAWGGALSATGIVVAYLAFAGLAEGRTWSVWPDMRLWQPYLNYPFTNTEAAMIGSALAIFGLILPLAPKFPTLFNRGTTRANRT